jgi:hypothetical protein
MAVDCFITSAEHLLGRTEENHESMAIMSHISCKIRTKCYLKAEHFFIIILFVRLLALRPLLAYCASLG